MEFKGNLPGTEPSLSDWEWVKKQIAEDAPVPYDADDVADGLYDPNDDEAVDRALCEANRVYPPNNHINQQIPKAS